MCASMSRTPKNDKIDEQARLARVWQMAVALTELAEDLHETACAAQSPKLTDRSAKKLVGERGQRAIRIDVLAKAMQVLAESRS